MPDLISERMPNKGTDVQPNYTYKLLSRSPASLGADRAALWADVNAAAENYINGLHDQGCKVSAFNRSKDKKTGAITDDVCVVVISWDNNAADNIADQMRPSGCCTIF